MEAVDKPRRTAAVVVLCVRKAVTQPNDGFCASCSIEASMMVVARLGCTGSCKSLPSFIFNLLTRYGNISSL